MRKVKEKWLATNRFTANKMKRLIRCVEKPPKAILLRQEAEARVEFFNFDEAYVRRLQEADPSTEQHFVAYFEQLLRIKLRSRRLSSEQVDDFQQETFVRAIAKIREGGLKQPDRLGAFVNSICNFVLQEHWRSSAKNQQPLEDAHMEIPDKVLDLEGMLVTKQSAEQVRRILDAMPKRDRDLLRAIFLDDKEKDTVCQEMGVDREYLRVLLHRAKDKFKALYEKGQMGVARSAMETGKQ